MGNNIVAYHGTRVKTATQIGMPEEDRLSLRLALLWRRVSTLELLYDRYPTLARGKRGRCVICGCTDRAACAGGCSWKNHEHTLCSACTPGRPAFTIAQESEALG
jgi:hypothetical protein